MDYKETFGQYEQIKLDDKSFDEACECFDKILVQNPNMWGNSNLIDRLGETDPVTNILLAVKAGLINVYRYEFDEPEEPEKEEDIQDYNSLVQISRAKRYITQWLYWRAYNFFKSKGFYLKQESSTSTFLNISTVNTLKSRYSHAIHFFNDHKDGIRDDEEKSQEERICDNYSTIVRCGEIAGYRVFSELEAYDYLWIFPFIYEENYIGNKAYCYLLEGDKEFRNRRMEMMENLIKSINDKMNM